MPVEDPSFKVLGIIFVCALLLFGVFAAVKLMRPEPPVPAVESTSSPRSPKVVRRPLLDLDQLKSDPDLKAMIDKRKEAYGLDQGVDVIAKSDESIKIGGNRVSIREIIEKIEMQKGAFVERDVRGEYPGGVQDYGIYVVQPGDNIWNIHFKFLKDHFAHRSIDLSPGADEPNRDGFSSGVGKLLKFSENMVFIYNVKERSLASDLNLIHPRSKIVVYNMTQVFGLLNQIDYAHVNRIEFDGDTIWIPANQ